MVKVNPWQLEHEYRGYSERINLAFVWTAPDLQQRTIVCFFERTASRSGEPNWRRLLQNCKARAVFPWEQMIDKRQAIYVGVDSSYEGIARRAASRAHLTLSSGVAFPSEELAGVVHQTLQHASLYRFYQVCIKAIPDQSSGIYVVCEDEHPIYVGQTHSLLQRMTGHRHSQRKPDEIAGFMDYARYRHEQSDDWPVHILPYEQCASLAVQGQLTPDLMNNEEARQLLTRRYFQDPGWGLAQAEAALIACFRPHFNQVKNTYRRPLRQMDYCQQYCRLCFQAHKE